MRVFLFCFFGFAIIYISLALIFYYRKEKKTIVIIDEDGNPKAEDEKAINERVKKLLNDELAKHDVVLTKRQYQKALNEAIDRVYKLAESQKVTTSVKKNDDGWEFAIQKKKK